jgi:hypothetical protein
MKYKETAVDNTTDSIMNNINRKGGNVIYDDDNVKVIPKFKEYEMPHAIYTPNSTNNPPTTAAEILDELEKN